MPYYTHLEDFIQQFYTRLGIILPSLLNFTEVSQRLGLRVFYWSEPSQALFSKDKPYIFLNESLNKQQQWQEFCHELAHVLLHTGDQFYMYPLFREYQEYKANNFMYHACMPTFMLDEIQLYDYLPQTVVKLQELFNVEYEFALKRLTQYLNKRFYVPYWNSRKC
ncbi:ImmA/IrrE family metallo-endopeptidase [Lysinibacillus tabacifolii]|uniref:ImmA/IrrE family metallo-endopeptidase n=1 Tax=Lysinibacillus tabacifolii TaxID=1173107 RepID=A0ABY2T8G6_9BACI|nr:ImmA/IrrE family metallo-endopeptidase [Lysinibacillus tabacifolii]TKI50559.1 ImmA/IrrE family metallo-endopeptidase [Lysinibacillus tabacifolii]